MNKKIKVLNNKELNKLYNEISNFRAATSYDKEGNPIYKLAFNGTKEEFEELKKKLIK